MGGSKSPIDPTDSARWPAVTTAAECQGILVAYSGGADSTALLALLHAARVSERPPFSATGPLLAAVHIHHGLLPQADAWLVHAAAQCAAWKIPFFAERVVVDSALARAKGGEAAARVARYRAMAAVAERWGATLAETQEARWRDRPLRVAVALAHHRDDQVETFWFRLMRGAGVRGLTAMVPWAPFPASLRPGNQAKAAPAVECFLWRPLLGLTRAQLRVYLSARALSWVEDPSNCAYGTDPQGALRRNLLRAQVLPFLRTFWPGLDRLSVRTAALMGETQACLDDLALLDDAALADSTGGWRAAAFWALPPHRQRNLLRWAIVQAGHLPPSHARLTEALKQLAGAGRGGKGAQRQVALSGEIALATDRQRVWVIALQR